MPERCRLLRRFRLGCAETDIDKGGRMDGEHQAVPVAHKPENIVRRRPCCRLLVLVGAYAEKRGHLRDTAAARKDSRKERMPHRGVHRRVPADRRIQGLKDFPEAAALRVAAAKARVLLFVRQQEAPDERAFRVQELAVLQVRRRDLPAKNRHRRLGWLHPQPLRGNGKEHTGGACGGDMPQG